jgi:hypothetical protein
MKLKILLFLTILTLLTSCNGQTSNQQKHTIHLIKGDTVKQLGSSIMVVYQDKKNVYWFALVSWQLSEYILQEYLIFFLSFSFFVFINLDLIETCVVSS